MNSLLRRAAPLGAALSFALVAPAAFATTAVSGSMSLSAHASADAGGDTLTPSTDSWSGVPAGLAVSASASATDGTGTNTVSGQAAAAWTSADAGTVTFSAYGWDLQTLGEVDLTHGLPDWSYTFIADGNGTFTMNYDVTASGDTFGLWGWGIALTDSAGLPVSNPSDPTASGTFGGALVEGQTYTVSLSNNANLRGSGSTAAMDGEFDWSIKTTSVVPEPTGNALMLGGLAALGLARRRRQR